MKLSELFEKQTDIEKTTNYIVYNAKTLDVIYYGIDINQANKLSSSKTRLLKPLVKHTITNEDIELYSLMNNSFY